MYRKCFLIANNGINKKKPTVHLVGVLFNIVIEDARNQKPETGLRSLGLT
jgi:hypothetical protein